MDNPYKVLGLQEGASDDEVKAAYKRLAKNITRTSTLPMPRPA